MADEKETQRGNSVLIAGPGGKRWVGLGKARALVSGGKWRYVGDVPQPVAEPKPTPIAPTRTEPGVTVSGAFEADTDDDDETEAD